MEKCRRRDCLLRHQTCRLCRRPQSPKIVGCQALGPLEAITKLHSRWREFDAAVGTTKAILHCSDESDALNAFNEIEKPVPAAKITIGAAFQTNFLLQGDSLLYLLVFDPA